MAQWFLVPYLRRTSMPRPERYCAMDDFSSAIKADGGEWTETEVLGNHAIVKVRASAATLQTINAAQGFTRLPKDRLDDALSDLTQQQRTALRDRIEALGYARAEWQAALGTDLGAVTLRQVLVFVASRRLKPRYDAGTDTIVLDGPVQACRPVADVDSRLAD